MQDRGSRAVSGYYIQRETQHNVKLNGCSLEGERPRGLGIFGDICFFDVTILTLALATIMRLDKVPSAGQEFFNR